MDPTGGPTGRGESKPLSQEAGEAPHPQAAEAEAAPEKTAHGHALAVEKDRSERNEYANRVLRIVVGWLSALLLLIVLQGFSILQFRISDGVLMALIIGTTVIFFGIFRVIMNYLFPKR